MWNSINLPITMTLLIFIKVFLKLYFAKFQSNGLISKENYTNQVSFLLEYNWGFLYYYFNWLILLSSPFRVSYLTLVADRKGNVTSI